MILQFGNIKFLHKPLIVVTVRAWFCRMLVIGKDIIVIVNYFLQRLQHSEQLFAHRYLTAGVFCLWRVDNQLSVFFLPFYNIDTFYRPING